MIYVFSGTGNPRPHSPTAIVEAEDDANFEYQCVERDAHEGLIDENDPKIAAAETAWLKAARRLTRVADRTVRPPAVQMHALTRRTQGRATRAGRVRVRTRGSAPRRACRSGGSSGDDGGSEPPRPCSGTSRLASAGGAR